MKKSLLLFFMLVAIKGFSQTYPLVTIQQVQTVSQTNLANCVDTSDYHLDTVRVQGVVVMDGGKAQTLSGRNVWIQNGTGAFSGLDLYGFNSTTVESVSSLFAGMEVEVTGVIKEYQGETEIEPLGGNAITILNAGLAVQKQVVTLADLNDPNRNNLMQTGEQWEGSFIELHNVRVATVDYFSSNTRVSFNVVDQQGNRMNVSDRFLAQRLPAMGGTFTPPNVGDELDTLRGIVMHSKNNCAGSSGRGYELHPFHSSHYVYGEASPIISNVTRNYVTPTSSQAVIVTASISDPNGTISSASLFYTVGASSSAYTEVSMTNTTGNTYTATIPVQGDGSFVKYYISATDNASKTTINPLANVANGTHFYTVHDNGTTIYDLQYTPYSSGNSGYIDMQVTVTGIVTATAKANDLGYTYIQQENQLSWGGIMILGTAPLTSLNRGDKITVTGTVLEDFGFTRLTNVSSVTVNGTGTINPLEVDPSIFTAYSFAASEQYESMLVTLKNPATGQKLYIVDVNADAPSTSTTPNFGEYRVGTDQFDPQNGTRVLAGRQSSNAFSSLNFSLVNSDTWATVDGVMNVTPIIVSDTMTMDALTGVMYYSFANMKLIPRNDDDLVGFNTQVGIEFNGSNAVNITVYPNPANETVRIASSVNENLTVIITDITGRELTKRNIINNTELVDLTKFNSGCYFVTVLNQNNEKIKVSKLIVKH